MRGNVADQDLTNYALNELPPDERFYVESMLAVSEECRHDVYRMLDLSEMLKEGFAQQEEGAALMLDESQRSNVLTVPRWQWRGFLQRAAAVAFFAAGTAYAVKHPAMWQWGGAADRIAGAGTAVQVMVDDVQSKGLPTSAKELVTRMLGAAKSSGGTELQFISAPAVCTPPTILDMPAMPEVVEM
jgi:anti-sigma factor RsiW